MSSPTPSIQALARRLLAIEAATPDRHTDAAVRVCQKLQGGLARVAGARGFESLLRRAVALAHAEVPILEVVRVNADGTLKGLEQVAADTSNGGAEAGLALISHLLGLLATFVGESLTLRLVRNVWPDASFHG